AWRYLPIFYVAMIGAVAQWAAFNREAHVPPGLKGRKVRTPKCDDSRQTLDPLLGLVQKLSDRGRLRKPLSSERHLHSKNVIRIEARVYSPQRHKGADEQSRASKQNKGQRHFCND